jgi:O-antigen ligase
MGRDSTFSGRQTLWAGVIDAIQAKYSILGAGYGAFFTPKGAVNFLTPYLMHWGSIPEHAHNGLLNTWANIGIPGVVLGILLIVVLAARLLARLISDPTRKLWAASTCLLFLFLVNNVAASTAFTHSDIAWALIIIVYCYVGMDEKNKNAPAASGRYQQPPQPENAVPKFRPSPASSSGPR